MLSRCGHAGGPGQGPLRAPKLGTPPGILLGALAPWPVWPVLGGVEKVLRKLLACVMRPADDLGGRGLLGGLRGKFSVVKPLSHFWCPGLVPSPIRKELEDTMAVDRTLPGGVTVDLDPAQHPQGSRASTRVL